MVADLVPDADGLNVTWKLVEPAAATEELGADVTEKSDALVPVIFTELIERFELPVF